MIFKIPVEIYKTDVWVYVDEPPESVRKHYLSKVGRLDDMADALAIPDGTEARTILHRSRLNFISFGADPTPECIAHESLHVALSILREVGFRLTWKSEEAACYLLGYLVKKIHEKL